MQELCEDLKEHIRTLFKLAISANHIFLQQNF